MWRPGKLRFLIGVKNLLPIGRPRRPENAALCRAALVARFRDFPQGYALRSSRLRRHRLILIDARFSSCLPRSTYSPRMRIAQAEYERRALEKGKVAVWSICRDWIKGQITAIETGILTFEGTFLGSILLPSGETITQHIERQKLLPLPAPAANVRRLTSDDALIPTRACGRRLPRRLRHSGAT